MHSADELLLFSVEMLTNITTTEFNQLSGTIPTELVQLSSLFFLALGGKFEMYLLAAGNYVFVVSSILMKRLLILTTDNFKLSGPIPTELGQMSSLIHLYLGEMLICVLLYLLVNGCCCVSNRRF
jgi:hypothetical protein